MALLSWLPTPFPSIGLFKAHVRTNLLILFNISFVEVLQDGPKEFKGSDFGEEEQHGDGAEDDRNAQPQYQRDQEAEDRSFDEVERQSLGDVDLSDGAKEEQQDNE